jgi:hypothetical protein
VSGGDDDLLDDKCWMEQRKPGKSAEDWKLAEVHIVCGMNAAFSEV